MGAVDGLLDGHATSMVQAWDLRRFLELLFIFEQGKMYIELKVHKLFRENSGGAYETTSPVPRWESWTV